MPYVSELALFLAAFVAAYTFGEAAVARLARWLRLRRGR
jgi:hypothetical protein